MDTRWGLTTWSMSGCGANRTFRASWRSARTARSRCRLINEVKASGLTPAQLGDNITQALSKFINNPQVMVAVQAVRSKRYFMSGEINRPGAYPLASPTTIFEAITMAGGFREFAGKGKVTIIRGNQRFRFNWNQVVKGKNLAQNIPLENGDQVVVP